MKTCASACLNLKGHNLGLFLMWKQISFGAIVVQLAMLLHKSACMCVIWKKKIVCGLKCTHACINFYICTCMAP